jgi:hypothetical protein
MSQIEAPKVLGYASLAVPEGHAAASKVVAYAWLTPGDSGADDSGRQGYTYGQTIGAR